MDKNKHGENIPEAVGRVIKTLREDGVKQHDVLTKALKSIENGKSLRVATIAKIAAALGLELAELFYLTGIELARKQD